MEIEKTIRSFLDEIDSTLLVPGGGCVASLIGSLGASLGRMYAHVSINKKAYLQLDELTKNEFEHNFNELLTIRSNFEKLIDEDKIAYEELVKSFKLPKESVNDVNYRNTMIYQNTIRVTKSPLMMMEEAVKGLKTLSKMLPFGNKNAITDGLVGAICLHATLHGAFLNVNINLSGMDEKDSNKYKELSNDLLNKGDIIYKQIREKHIV